MLSTPFSGVDVTSNADDDVRTIFDDGNRGFTNDDGACLAAETTVAASRAKARKEGERMMMMVSAAEIMRITV